MNYEIRFVLFLDILGFQKIIDQTTDQGKDEESKITELIDTLRMLKNEVNQGEASGSRMITQFSDSLVISFKEEDVDEYTAFLRNVRSLIIKLIQRNILCRGAISYGKLVHTNDVVFGPALNEAYLTESTAALFPRVILDQSIVSLFRQNIGNGNSNSWALMQLESKLEAAVNIDTDDKFYIDYFRGSIAHFQDSRVLDYFKKLKQLITNGEKHKSPNIKSKYGWMKNKYNSFLDWLPDIIYEYDLNSEYLMRLSELNKLN